MRFFLCLSVCVGLLAAPSEYQERVRCHLLVGDLRQACETCKAGLILYPKNEELKQLHVESLAKAGYEKDALMAWKEVDVGLKGEARRHVLESLAWGVLSKASHSEQFVARYAALMGARGARDAQSVEEVKRALRSTSGVMRAVGVRMACELRDASLVDEIKRLFFSETHFYVRLEVMRAVGYLGLSEMGHALKEIIADGRTMAEEKACAIEALVNLYDEIDEREFNEFVQSKRAGLRAIAPQIVLHLDRKEWLDKLKPLLNDPTSFVQILTLAALTYSGEYDAAIDPLLHDTHSAVSVSAAWSLMTLDRPEGEKRLAELCVDKNEQTRRLAAAALASTGNRGHKLCAALVQASSDPYVRVNCAVGLLLKQYKTGSASHALLDFLQHEKGNVSWDRSEHPLFRTVAPSRARHMPGIPAYPKMLDQLTRLELLGAVAIADPKRAQPAIQDFLEAGHWGVSHTACVTLLSENRTESMAAIEALKDAKSLKVRLQAALVLAFMGRDEGAIEVLEEGYAGAPRELKLTILEALGAIGAERSLPFLVGVLDEPFQVVRIVAASSILQCLYH